MNLALHHHCSLAGTSITKTVGFGCAVMRQVGIRNWSKTTASAGFEV